MQRIVEHGIDINAINDFECTALHVAKTPEIVVRLYNNGADINNQNSFFGMTPLMVAVRGNRNDVAQKLLELGADPTLKDSCGHTVFQSEN